MSQHERDLLVARYWTFYEGSPVPQWIEDLVGLEVLDIYAVRYGTTRWFEHWWCIACAIELENRRQSVTSLRQLRRVASRVRKIGYDFSAAITLSDDVMEENWTRYLKSCQTVAEWGADALRRRIEASPAAIQLRKELATKKLPQGAAANLALMRAIVGLEKSSCDDSGAGASSFA
jgi:hypothetical protein